MLALTPAYFHLDGVSPFVVLKTLKQRERGKGRPKKDDSIHRVVPLSDLPFVRRLREYFATFRPLRHERLWPMKSDNTLRNWIGAAIAHAQRR